MRFEHNHDVNSVCTRVLIVYQPMKTTSIVVFTAEDAYTGAGKHTQTTLAPAQTRVLHLALASATQSLPPFAGAGLLQVLVCVPPSQALEHAPKPDHPQSSGVPYPVTPSATQQLGVL